MKNPLEGRHGTRELRCHSNFWYNFLRNWAESVYKLILYQIIVWLLSIRMRSVKNEYCNIWQTDVIKFLKRPIMRAKFHCRSREMEFHLLQREVKLSALDAAHLLIALSSRSERSRLCTSFCVTSLRPEVCASLCMCTRCFLQRWDRGRATSG